jgi:hypothetical protein
VTAVPAIPATLMRALRQQVASTIADAKAYDVPGLCSRLGLAAGTGEEAHRSKFKYAQQRLTGVVGDRVLAIARELLSEFDSYELTELVAKIDELSGSPVTPLTVDGPIRRQAVFDRTRTSRADRQDLADPSDAVGLRSRGLVDGGSSLPAQRAQRRHDQSGNP